MPIFQNDKNEWVNFIHIPKTGGTSIENMLEKEYEIYFFSKYDTIFQVTPQHLDRKKAEILGLDKITGSSFCIVRHPVDRFISEYKYRLEISPSYFKVLNLDTFAKLAFRRYKSNNNVFDNHIRPQTDFVFSDTKIYYFEQHLKSIHQFITQEFSINKLNLIPHSKKSSNIKVKLSEKCYNSICHYYDKDFQILGYNKNRDEYRFYKSNKIINILRECVFVFCEAIYTMLKLIKKRIKKI